MTEITERTRSIAKARQSFNATAPRRGRVMLQAERGLIIHDGAATTAQLAEWCFPCARRLDWHYNTVRRSLRLMGARAIGRAGGVARPIIWRWTEGDEPHTENPVANSGKN